MNAVMGPFEPFDEALQPMLEIRERNLRAMVSRGQLPVVELGGKVLFDPDDLQDLKRKHKTVRNQIW